MHLEIMWPAVIILFLSNASHSDVPRTAASPSDGFGTLEALKALDCIEDWAQLCSPPVGPRGYLGPSIFVYENRVTVSPFDADSFAFGIVERTGEVLRLKLESYSDPDVKLKSRRLGEAAVLRIGKDGHGVFEGPDVYALLEGKIEHKQIPVVANEIYNKRHDELVKRLVPGGECPGLMGYQASGTKPCLNKPSSEQTRNDRQGDGRFLSDDNRTKKAR